MKLRLASAAVVCTCIAAVSACGSSEPAGHGNDPTADGGTGGGAASAGAGRGGSLADAAAGRAGAAGAGGADAPGGMAGMVGPGGRAAQGGTGTAAAGGVPKGLGGAEVGGGNAGADAGSGGTCSGAPTTVLFVVDSSSSMNDRLPAGNQPKWNVTRDVLVAAIDALPDSLRVGLMFFPEVPEPRMPCFKKGLAMPFAPLDAGGRDAWRAALSSVQVTGSTPTYDAYAFAEAQLQPLQGEGATLIVLVTDGLPSYGPECTGEGPPATVEWDSLVAMVESAAQAGTRTLAVAAPASPDVHEMLTAVANAGAPRGLCARNITPGCFYDLDTSTELGSWLGESVALAGDCPP